ncbi:iron-containing alcohol dehydrogenase [Aminirod propionatiphilus]|uniref:Iron-containing alcohol dehydrogenase n=1 Tax=Aminirod propionatiphilus TaxID=3415223 RepID=A0ACD1DUU5_9BACT|nr:iron-containing alcohol dehydrogenase [Synergistota bacterium]
MPGSYFMPPVNLIERGALRKVGFWARSLGGKRALVVASLGAFGESQGRSVLEVLEEAGLAGSVWAGAGPNPTDLMVAEGAGRYRSDGADFLVAVGGGSAMDCAKAIGLVVTGGGVIADYEGLHRSAKDLPPLIAVNTTAGTGSEVTNAAVITDTERHVKMTILDWRITPRLSVNDPEMMVSMPPSLTAATGMDALSHAVEAYVSIQASPITDSLAYKATELIFLNLPRAVRDGGDIEAREGMCHAAFLAGLAFSNSGLGYVHALSHPLSARYDLAHGVVNAVLLPAVERFNLPVAMDKLAYLARAMEVALSWRSERENAERSLKAMEGLRSEIGLAGRLASLGVRLDDLPGLAREASLEIVGKGNPREGSVAALEQIYRDVF